MTKEEILKEYYNTWFYHKVNECYYKSNPISPDGTLCYTSRQSVEKPEADPNFFLKRDNNGYHIKIPVWELTENSTPEDFDD